MDRYEQAAILTELIDSMRARGSWTGETHIQKATYFLQDLLGVPLGFDFILYKHGPFSFDVRDALSMMRADELVSIEVQPYPYGPRLASTDLGRGFKAQYQATLRQHSTAINCVADRLGARGVTELERLATALFVSLQNPQDSSETR